MAKKPKVPLNVLVVEGTRQAIRDLADALECSQGEVVDRAVILLAANRQAAKGLAGVSLPISGDIIVDRELPPQTIRSSVNGDMSGDAVGPELSSNRGKVSVETRRPLREKGDQKR